MSKGDVVHLNRWVVPVDYHCDCEFCTQVIGELRPEDGSYYSRLERRQYYDSSESGKEGHVAKTPLHVARWAIQAYSKPGDWILDPTIGAGTTAVEAITQGRNVAGMELQFGSILTANLEKNQSPNAKAVVRFGDAREVRTFLEESEVPPVSLVVNNPPYSGDEHWTTLNVPEGSKHQSTGFYYQDGLPNLAFLREGDEYWTAMRGIYGACIDHLVPGGHFVTGIKDMMRKKQPFMLHQGFCHLLVDLGLEPVGTAFLKHYPGTLFLNTYEKRYGVTPPLYQTINVFRKPL